MITIYAVYLDAYFVENLLLDIMVLILTTILWDKRVRWKRVLIASVTGAALSCCFFMLQMKGCRALWLYNLLQGYVVLKLAYRRMKLQELIRGALYFYTISFAYIKIYEKVREHFGEIHGMVLSAVIMLFISGVIAYLKYCKRKEKEDVYYDVEILGKGKKIQVRALYDTGNVLREPISGKPVSVVEKKLLAEIIELEKMESYKYIPFRSVGEENGVLIGIEVDGLRIHKNDECIERYCEIVALYEGQLSADGRFGMILHQGLL